MAFTRVTSSHRLFLAVLLPLLMLGTFAVRGMKAQSKAAWDAMEEEAARAAMVAADHLAREFQAKVREVPRFPDPPVPGSPSPMDAVLDGGDIPALLALRDSPEAGTSPAGLPRRILAALRLLELDPEFLRDRAADRGEIARLATEECPSVLTGLVIQKLGMSDGASSQRWKDVEEALLILRSHPEGGWIPRGDSYAWVRQDGSQVSFLSTAAVLAILQDKQLSYAAPKDFGIRISTGKDLPRSSAAPAIFGAAPVSFGEGLRAEVYLHSPDQAMASLRRQQLWTYSALALAAVVSLGGLYLIHRTLQRERKLNEMKSQFVASVSHELRAPVASIRLMADALEEGKMAPETAKEFHRLIAREGARLSTLVGNVLDHARIEQGRRIWKMESCDLAALVAETLRVMEPLTREKELALLSSLEAVEASVDAGAIQQALVNLLDNAIKFSPRGKSIGTSLAIHDESRTWTLSVSDEGSGIPKEEQSRIFERFYRPGDELRRETQGTGIGLSLVKSIVDAHGGSVTVESEPGKGSTFTLRLPISTP